MTSITRRLTLTLLGAALALGIGPAVAKCVDSVVLVHGNASYPSSWSRTYNRLRNNGYARWQIKRPNWGSKTCAACNNHAGWELDPVVNAIRTAKNQSCTGRIDVIGHSMGVTLAAKAIRKLGIVGRVDAFVGIAGAFRGLWSCGRYPYHVRTSTCGRQGLSVSSPLLDNLRGRNFGRRHRAIYSWIDQIVCSTGVCTVGGTHSSRIWSGRRNGRNYTRSYGHFGLQKYTSRLQYNLIN